MQPLVLGLLALVPKTRLSPPPTLQPHHTLQNHYDPLNLYAHNTNKPLPRISPSTTHRPAPAATLAAAAAAASLAQPALAKGGEYGIFEGRIVSLAHPAIMATCYAASAWAAFTGFQWRRLRELGDQISELKEQQKGPKAKLEALEAPDPALESQVSALQSEIDALAATRKELAGQGLRDKHYQIGSVLLGLGTSFAIEGPVNTFLRAQKLFPGPHLYAGAGVVVSWAMAASLVPLMAKGKDSARTAHIAFNLIGLALFTWQLPTGWEIMLKVIKFTKFP